MILLLLATAHAATWSDFGSAFPVFPCQDGWVGCLVGKTAVGPEPRGPEVTPSDLRLGFFDLDATASFSPFVAFGVYPENPVAGVAVEADPAPATPVERPPGHTVREEAVPKPVVTPKPDPIAAPGLGRDPEPLPAPVAKGCDDLPHLEPLAMLGKLDEPTRACLEGGATTGAMTSRNRYSRVLMADSWGKGDREGWSKLAKRHLEDIEGSDAELAYKYALQLQRDAKHEATILWAERSLEGKVQWTGDTYVDRVAALHKLRSMAAQGIWKRAEEASIAAPSGAASAAAESARNRTKTFAREWYEYTASAQRDPTKALQLCIAAAGTADYCKGS